MKKAHKTMQAMKLVNPFASLSEEIKSTILDCLDEDSETKKSFSLVCKSFHSIESHQRKTLKPLYIELISRILTRYPLIHHVDLTYCPRVEDRVLWSISNAYWSTLKSINLSRSRFFTHMGLSSLASKCWGLIELDLSNATELTDAGAAAIAEAKNLEKLWMARCKLVSDIGIGCIAVGCKKLKLICLKWCVRLTDLGVGLIATKCKDIQSLDLSYLLVLLSWYTSHFFRPLRYGRISSICCWCTEDFFFYKRLGPIIEIYFELMSNVFRYKVYILYLLCKCMLRKYKMNNMLKISLLISFMPSNLNQRMNISFNKESKSVLVIDTWLNWLLSVTSNHFSIKKLKTSCCSLSICVRVECDYGSLETSTNSNSQPQQSSPFSFSTTGSIMTTSFTDLLSSDNYPGSAGVNGSAAVRRGLGERIAERTGSGVPKFKSLPPPSLPLSPPPVSPSSYFSIPPGLSPAELLDSPVLLSASK
ncbi:Hypothetical predicted protein, partial [Olea europaea subsp. europaea]